MRCLPVSVLILASGLTSQTTATFPAGFLSTEAGSSSLGSFFGTHSGTFRTMLLSNARGRNFAMKEIAFRPDYRNYEAEPYAGRTWARVDLKMAEADTWIANNSFSKRLKTTQTLVFSGSVTWPSLTRLPPTRPAPFSLRLPFRTPWNYTGKFDVAADFALTGGRLAWGTGWSYPLDFARNAGFGTNLSYHASRIGLPFCRDTRRASAALLTSEQTLRLKPYWPTTQMSIVIRGANMVDQPAVLAVGVAGNLLGQQLSFVTCQRLYLDLSKPAVYLPVQSRSNSFFVATPYTSITNIGASFFAQAIWADSITGAARLTPAVWQHIFDEPRASGHVEMSGYGDAGGIHRYGAPLYRFVR